MTFDSAIEAHTEALKAFAQKLTRNTADAEDLMQTMWVKAFSNWNSFVPKEGSDPSQVVKAWLCEIMMNCFRMNLRKKSPVTMALQFRRPLVTERDDYREELDTFQEERPLLLEEQICDEVLEALAATDEVFRNTLIQHTIGDQKYTEIAEEMGISVGTVKSRCARAAAQMRSHLISALG